MASKVDAVVENWFPRFLANGLDSFDVRRTLNRVDGWEDWHNELERMRDPTHERARSPREWREVAANAGLTVRDSDVVYQHHDVEDWMDRVDCPPDRRQRVLAMLRDIPDQIRDVYRPGTVNGRLYMRTPQCVLVASI